MEEHIQQYIKQALEGDQKAYECLLLRYKNGIYNLIFQMIKNHEETEDLVIQKLPLDEAVERVLTGEISDVISVAGLLKLKHII